MYSKVKGSFSPYFQGEETVWGKGKPRGRHHRGKSSGKKKRYYNATDGFPPIEEEKGKYEVRGGTTGEKIRRNLDFGNGGPASGKRKICRKKKKTKGRGRES